MTVIWLHTAVPDQSVRSYDYHSKFISQVFLVPEQRWVINNNMIENFVFNKIQDELNSAKFYCLSADASNTLNLRLFTYISYS